MIPSWWIRIIKKMLVQAVPIFSRYEVALRNVIVQEV